MKINLKSLELKKGLTVSLSGGVSYYNLNLKTLLYYENFKTTQLNLKYFYLVPQKILKLKELKNLLININRHWEQKIGSFEQDLKIQNLKTLKEENPQLFGELLQLSANSENNKAILENFLSQEKEYLKAQSKDLKLKDLIKLIDKRIKQYKAIDRHRKPLFNYKITPRDLYLLEQGVTTENSKKIIYYYLIKLKKAKISNTTYFYLNHPLTKEILKANMEQNTQYNKEEGLNNHIHKVATKNNFSELFKEELENFEQNFLNKCL